MIAGSECISFLYTGIPDKLPRRRPQTKFAWGLAVLLVGAEGVFSTEKRRGVFVWAGRPCGSCHPLRAPVLDAAHLWFPFDPDNRTPGSSSPGPSCMAPQSKALRSTTASRASPRAPGPGEEPQPPAVPYPGRLRSPLAQRSVIGLDTSNQPLMALPSHEQPRTRPLARAGRSQLYLTAKARDCPERPRHCTAHRRSPRPTAKYLEAAAHSESPQPTPPRASCPSSQAPHSGPQSRPAPASHLSKPPQIPIAIQHPFVTHLIL